jgi:hypothetical protein
MAHDNHRIIESQIELCSVISLIYLHSRILVSIAPAHSEFDSLWLDLSTVLLPDIDDTMESERTLCILQFMCAHRHSIKKMIEYARQSQTNYPNCRIQVEIGIH